VEDISSVESQEWLDALESVIKTSGKDQAAELLSKLSRHADDKGVEREQSVTTPYRNSIPIEEQKPMPGDPFMERRIRSLIRWNAMAMVMKTNVDDDSLGFDLIPRSQLTWHVFAILFRRPHH